MIAIILLAISDLSIENGPNQSYYNLELLHDDDQRAEDDHRRYQHQSHHPIPDPNPIKSML
jgi:hypothetical protein